MPRPRCAPLLRALTAALALGATAASAFALFVNTAEPVPVDRLVSNLTRHVKERPKDAHGHYVLGRVHAMAWAMSTEKLHVQPAKKEGGLPSFAPWQTVRLTRPEHAKPDKKALLHFHLAVHHYRRSLRLDDDKPLPHLGLAWLLDSATRWIPLLRNPEGVERKSKMPPEERHRYETQLRVLAKGDEAQRAKARRELIDALPRSAWVAELFLDHPEEPQTVRDAAADLLTRHWHDMALTSYRRAWELSLAADLKKDSMGMEGDDAVSIEAGQAMLRLLKGRTLDAKQKKEKAAIEAGLEKLGKKGRWITPIVFPTDHSRPLSSLFTERRTASFDLDGDGEPGAWPWPDAGTGILVWAPDDDVPVVSGRQLFGSVTWWIAWRNGYEPLAALDDDGDGALRGAELAGLGVWRDLDGNAVAAPGEVVPADVFGITSIAVRPDGDSEGVPANTRGVRLRDGTVLPTYDWTPERLDPDAVPRKSVRACHRTLPRAGSSRSTTPAASSAANSSLRRPCRTACTSCAWSGTTHRNWMRASPCDRGPIGGSLQNASSSSTPVNGTPGASGNPSVYCQVCPGPRNVPHACG